jgi:FeS assembly SUF system protein
MSDGSSGPGEPEVEISMGGAGDQHALVEAVIAALRTIQDPEIPLNIYDLGLIYRINTGDGIVGVDMTLTAPGCPVAGDIVSWVDKAVREIPGVETAIVNLVFEPPWDKSKMSDAAKLQLGLL